MWSTKYSRLIRNNIHKLIKTRKYADHRNQTKPECSLPLGANGPELIAHMNCICNTTSLKVLSWSKAFHCLMLKLVLIAIHVKTLYWIFRDTSYYDLSTWT